MKIKCLAFFITICGLSVNAQTPSKFNFQGVARNSAGEILVDTRIKLRFSILDSSSKGQLLYRESRTATTDSNGLFAAVIGGAGASGITGNIAGIPWNKNDKFLKVEIDTSGGNSFINLGTTQLLSVPYAEQARKADSSSVATKATTLQTVKFIGELPFNGQEVYSGQAVTLVVFPQSFPDTNYNVTTGIYTIPSRGYYYVGFNCAIQVLSNSVAKGTITNAETFPIYINNPNAFEITTTYANGGIYFYQKGRQISVTIRNNSSDGSNRFTVLNLPGRLSIYKVSE